VYASAKVPTGAAQHDTLAPCQSPTSGARAILGSDAHWSRSLWIVEQWPLTPGIGGEVHVAPELLSKIPAESDRVRSAWYGAIAASGAPVTWGCAGPAFRRGNRQRERSGNLMVGRISSGLCRFGRIHAA